jgi:hypothetical protein
MGVKFVVDAGEKRVSDGPRLLAGFYFKESAVGLFGGLG